MAEPFDEPAVKSIETEPLFAVIVFIVGAAGACDTKTPVVTGGVKVNAVIAFPVKSEIVPEFKSKGEVTDIPSRSRSAKSAGIV